MANHSNPTTHFKKGQSGNPSGRPKQDPAIRELARIHSVRAMERAVELIESKDENVALKAVNTVLDRAYGKPSQPIDGDGEGGPVNMSVTVKFIKPTKE
jgi:hypothetical protein